MGKGIYSRGKSIPTTRFGGKYGHKLPVPFFANLFLSILLIYDDVDVDDRS